MFIYAFMWMAVEHIMSIPMIYDTYVNVIIFLVKY